jgi:outer membrane lipoprotein-sorting protein
MKKLFGVLLFLAASLALADVTYTFKTTNSGDKAKETMVQTGTGYLKAPNLFRVDYTESNNPVMASGTWMFSKDLKTLYFVNPKEKTYSVMDMDGMIKAAGAMANAVVQMEVENPKASLIRGTQDQALAGFSCKHYVMDTSYTMKMKVLFMKSSSQVSTHRDLWASDGFPITMRDYFQSQAFLSGYRELDKVIELEKVKVPGYILKTRSTTETKSEKGQISRSTGEFEILTLKTGTVPASSFEVPQGYKEVSFMEGMAQGSEGKKDKGKKEGDGEEQNPLNSLFGK